MGFNPSKTTFYQNGSKKVFSPQGPIYNFGSPVSSRQKNPISTYGYSSTTAARFFIGLSVGATQVFTIDDVVSFFKGALGKCGRKDSSYLLQKGVYEYDSESPRVSEHSERREVVNPLTHEVISYNTVPKNDRVVVENSVQVIVLDLFEYSNQLSKEAKIRIFANNCLEIAEKAATKFLQDSVIVDIQVDGKTALLAAALPLGAEDGGSVKKALDELTCHLLGLDEKNSESLESIEYLEVLRQIREQYEIAIELATSEGISPSKAENAQNFAKSLSDIPENSTEIQNG